LKVEYRRSFLKDLSRIPSKTRKEIEKFAFIELHQADSIAQIGKVERMKGYPSFFKVRFGSYRVGIRLEENIAVLERALHRKEIYRYFP
jgi:mRNA interferase RelE/StbE